MLKPLITHPWRVCKADALRIQRRLAQHVVRHDRLGAVQYVAGVDASYDESGGRQFAAAVVLDADSLEVIEFAAASGSMPPPYEPGLFAFRELPVIAAALQKLKTAPDLVVCDGQGIAHPRRFGLASHLGVLFNIPTIGCSKTRLIGVAGAPGLRRGDHAPLSDQGDIIGRVLRTQDNIKPIYVSVGHLISLKTACSWILRLAPYFRLPETTRQADRIVRRCKKNPGFFLFDLFGQ